MIDGHIGEKDIDNQPWKCSQDLFAISMIIIMIIMNFTSSTIVGINGRVARAVYFAESARPTLRCLIIITAIMIVTPMMMIMMNLMITGLHGQTLARADEESAENWDLCWKLSKFEAKSCAEKCKKMKTKSDLDF